jgi:hypothetical protein
VTLNQYYWLSSTIKLLNKITVEKKAKRWMEDIYMKKSYNETVNMKTAG